jgi:geranylgeranyl diphosphate synthase type II
MAILSGIALLNLAFAVVGSMRDVSDRTRLEIVRVISEAVGSNGLIGGQVMDLRERSAVASQSSLERLNGLKTGALFVASVEIGALVAGAPQSTICAVRQFGAELGLALQIADDIIDDPAHAGRTGKDTGKDVDKPTLPRMLGKEAALDMMRTHLRAANDCLNSIGAGGGLLSRYVDGTIRSLLE